MLSSQLVVFVLGLVLFFGGLIMLMNSEPPGCTGWCCRIPVTNITNMSTSLIPYQPQSCELTLKSYCKQQHGKYSDTLSAVNVMDNFLSGLTVLSVPHQPIYSICKLATLRNNESGFVHKNTYPFIGISGKRGSRFELYATAFLSQALLRPKNSVLVLTGVTSQDSPAFQAWNDLIQDGIVHWYQTDIFQNGSEFWVKGTMKAIEKKTSVSEYLNILFCKYINVTSNIRYYVTSREREDEIFKAYQNDVSFFVDNVTSAIHGCVLKCLFPKITLSIADEPRALVAEEKELFPDAIEFLQSYFLV